MLFLTVIVVMVVMLPPTDPENKVHLWAASQLPVSDQGRIKPLDSLARTTLFQISERQEWRDEDKAAHSALEWLLDVTSAIRQEPAHYPSEEIQAFRIDNDWLRNLLQLPPQPENLYSFKEIQPHLDRLQEELQRLRQQAPGQKNANDKSLIDLLVQCQAYSDFRRLETPHRVFRIVSFEVLDLLLLKPHPGSYQYSFSEIVPRISMLIKAGEQAEGKKPEQRDFFDTKVLDLFLRVKHYIRIATLSQDTLYVVPPAAPGQPWQTFEEASSEGRNPAFAQLLDSYRPEKPDKFNQVVDGYQVDLWQKFHWTMVWSKLEAIYNHAAPFYLCIYLYGFIAFLACLSWLVWSEPLRRAAFGLLILALVIQFLGMLARMFLMGRPVFITNLYGTAVFIGWVGGLIGLVIEVIFPRAIGLAVAAQLALLTAIVGHNLAGGDTLENVEAVLNTNFWLATHVTAINIGYAVALFAGLLGANLILRGLLTPSLDRNLIKILGQAIYGVLCFGLFFSFVGTVSGGFWADVSWGRFWGWDPKENGALLIVIMWPLILHARWVGLIQTRGMAVLAVLGNIIVVWSWFHVNMLGIGLHAYGAAPERMRWVNLAYALHLGVALLGLLPMSLWRSYAALKKSKELSGEPPEPLQPHKGVPMDWVPQ